MINEIIDQNKEYDINGVIDALCDGEFLEHTGCSQEQVEEAYAEALAIQEWLEKNIYTGIDGHTFCPSEISADINTVKGFKEWIESVCFNLEIETPKNVDNQLCYEFAARYLMKIKKEYENS